jgi:Transposase IS200 like
MPIERFTLTLHENMDLYGVALIGYRLMSNHVHLIATPTKAEGFAEALKQIQGRYACYWECRAPIKRARLARTILFLPSRPDAPLGSIALHRTESVAGSFGLRARALALVERRRPLRHQPARCVLGSRWVRRHWTATTRREYLGEGEIESKLVVIRQRTHTGATAGNGMGNLRS